jgi:glycosyl transferase, family 25
MLGPLMEVEHKRHSGVFETNARGEARPCPSVEGKGMKIFVINLPENNIRRKSIERQLRSLNLAFEISSAVRGISLTPHERRHDYDERRCIRRFGRSLSSGELGCALSHIACYRKVVENRMTHALVLEDDAWLNPNLPQLLAAIEEQYSPDEANIFLLSWTLAVKKPFRRLWAGYGLQPVRSAQCAHAYVVSQAAAKALLKALYPVHGVADCWDWMIRHNVANLRAVIPPCVTCDLAYDSGIAPELRTMIGSWPRRHRVLRKLSRAWWRAVDGIAAVLDCLHGSRSRS